MKEFDGIWHDVRQLRSAAACASGTAKLKLLHRARMLEAAQLPGSGVAGACSVGRVEPPSPAAAAAPAPAPWWADWVARCPDGQALWTYRLEPGRWEAMARHLGRAGPAGRASRALFVL